MIKTNKGKKFDMTLSNWEFYLQHWHHHQQQQQQTLSL